MILKKLYVKHMLKEIVFLKFLNGVFLMVLNAKRVEREFS